MGNHPAILALRPNKYNPGSVVVITGGTKGIGRELALRYARRKCSLVLAARGRDALEATKLCCEEEGAAACLTVPTDVTDEAACKHLVDETIGRFGGIDVLILNAGVSAHFPFSEFADMGLFSRLLDVNFFGYVYCTKYALPHLKRNHGHIIVISSISGEIGLPLRSAYCASKFAVTGFFEALRMECGDQVDVTICCPPSVKTGMRDEKAFLAADRMLEELRCQSAASSPVAATPRNRRSAGSPMEAAEGQGKKEEDRSEDRRMPVEECVDYVSPSFSDRLVLEFELIINQCQSCEIMKGADKRARKVMFPLYSYLAVYVRPFLPDIIDPLIKRAAKL